MTEPTRERERTYRFVPIDRTGVLLGLSGAQCGILGVAVLAGGAALRAGAPAVVTLLPLVVGAVVAFAGWGGHPLHELLPRAMAHAVGSVGRGNVWLAPLPLLTGTAADRGLQPALPSFLAGLDIVDLGPAPWAGPSASSVGAIADRRERTLSASLPVAGREFSLAERDDQDRIIAGWGDVLGGFCTERGPVSRVRVTEWSAPVGVTEHERFWADRARPVSDAADATYTALLAQAGPLAIRHEVLVTVTIDLRQVGTRARAARPDDTAASTLMEELRLLTSRLEAAGLTTGPPLSVTQTAAAFRHRLDPTAIPTMRRRPVTLADAAGLSPRNVGPLATKAEWDRLVVDQSVHRTYWIAEWPRLDVPPSWLEPLLLHAGGVRTFALHYEPVPPSRSQRRIDRDSTRLSADEEQRARTGFRIGARHHRAQAAVVEREAELVAGYHELEYAGFVTVTASDADDLDRACAVSEQVAAQAGLELRALDGRHDLGLVCALPTGRGIAPRRVTT